MSSNFYKAQTAIGPGQTQSFGTIVANTSNLIDPIITFWPNRTNGTTTQANATPCNVGHGKGSCTVTLDTDLPDFLNLVYSINGGSANTYVTPFTMPVEANLRIGISVEGGMSGDGALYVYVANEGKTYQWAAKVSLL